MNLKPLALSVLLIPALIAMACQRANQIPPISIGPVIDNNTNPPEMARNGGVQGTIERLDPALDDLLAPDAKVEILADGITWAEGPVWYKGGLLFSDIPQNTIYRWTPEDGISVFMKPSGYTGTDKRGGEPGSNALTLDNQGRLTLCQHGDRRVIRIEKDDRTITVLADRYNGMRFSSPNDLCYDHNGNLYFSDPPYGLEKRDQDPKKEMDKNAVYLWRTDGQIIRLNTGDIVYPDGKTAPLNFPNGVALSPDDKILYLCVSDPDHPVWMKYDVLPSGNLANGKVFHDGAAWFAKKLPGLPDGIKTDLKGNVFTTGPGGVFIFSPEGKHLGTLLTNDRTANIGWGDDGSTLYICCNHRLCRIKTKTQGYLPGTPR
jgi:gluconolactonase